MVLRIELINCLGLGWTAVGIGIALITTENIEIFSNFLTPGQNSSMIESVQSRTSRMSYVDVKYARLVGSRLDNFKEKSQTCTTFAAPIVVTLKSEVKSKGLFLCERK